MLQVLEKRHGLRCCATMTEEDLDRPVLLALLNHAWQAEYGEQSHIMYDDSFLETLLGESTWVGIVVYADDGHPVAFDLAQKRLLYCHGQPLQAFYNTLFTVSSQYRGQGIGRWIVHTISRLLVEEHGTEVICTTFQPGYGGLPTVQHSLEQMPGWDLQIFHQAFFWGRRLDLAPVPFSSSALCVGRLALPAGKDVFTMVPVTEEGGCPHVPSAAALTADLRRRYQVAFGWEAGFQTRYLRPHTPQAGTFWYDFAPESHCAMSFDIVPLMVHGQRVAPLGRIQTVYTRHCNARQLYEACQHLLRYMQDQGCRLAGVLDCGTIPEEVLQALAFERLGEERLLAVRGAQANTRAFTHVHPPYLVDL